MILWRFDDEKLPWKNRGFYHRFYDKQLGVSILRITCQASHIFVHNCSYLFWLLRMKLCLGLTHIRISMIKTNDSLFNGFLVEKYVACQSRKSDLGWHRFRFSPCLMRERVKKSAVT